MMLKMPVLVFILFTAGLFACARVAVSQAAVYVHVDAEGTPHFTDTPTRPDFRPLPGFGLPPGANLNRGQYAELIDSIALDHGVDPALVRAIIRAESNFDQRAVSRKGAQGLMQLMPGTAGRYAVSDTFNPAENIRGGVRYLRFLQDRFPGQLHLAVAAYNAGENAVLRHKGIPPYTETRQYVARVFRFYDRPGVVQVTAARGAASADRPSASSVTRTYRQIGSDGTPHYSNMPPLVRTQSPSAR
jgi:soluble lytic murein transglycosylase